MRHQQHTRHSGAADVEASAVPRYKMTIQRLGDDVTTTLEGTTTAEAVRTTLDAHGLASRHELPDTYHGGGGVPCVCVDGCGGACQQVPTTTLTTHSVAAFYALALSGSDSWAFNTAEDVDAAARVLYPNILINLQKI